MLTILPKGVLMDTRVSIGLCVKNAKATIAATVKSILYQHFPYDLMEVIVVDGLSKDGTVDLIKAQFLKEQITLRVFYENSGLGTARQIVVENASGNYIVWVDGDMILTENFVEKQVEFMERNPAVGIAKGSYGFLSENSLVAILENMEFLVDSSECAGNIPPSHVLGTSGCIYRAKAIRLVGGFNKKLKGVGEDMDAEQRMRDAGWSLCLTDALFYEKRRTSWQSLWREYFWHGQGAHALFHTNRKAISLTNLFPPVAILSESKRSIVAYKNTHKKIALLLPLHWIFKRVAWILGFLGSIS
jgi:glycosyltransferase involved in cell wall biosynthesis